MSSLNLLLRSQRLPITFALPHTLPSTRLFTTTSTLKSQNRKPAPPKKTPRPLPNFTANQRVWRNETQRREFEEQEQRARSGNVLLNTHTARSIPDTQVRATPLQAHALPSHGEHKDGSACQNGNRIGKRPLLSRLREPETFRRFTIFALILALVSQGITIYTVYNLPEVVEYAEAKKFRMPGYATVKEMEKVCTLVENISIGYEPKNKLTE